jgi:hypothetical protein
MGGDREIFGEKWCKKGESGVKWGIERGFHACTKTYSALGKVVKINVLGHP